MGLAASRMITPMATPFPTSDGQLLPPNSKNDEFGIDGMQVHSPDYCELSGEWQALPCEMVSSTPVVAHQNGSGASREGFHTDGAHEPKDNSISLELDPCRNANLSPFQPVCKNELRELQQSAFLTSSLTNADRGPLLSWSAYSSSKDMAGDSHSSGAGNTVGDSSTAFARTLNNWQAVPEHSQVQDTSMVHQLLADRHLGDLDCADDWAVQPGTISADTTAMATDDALASLRASEVLFTSFHMTNCNTGPGSERMVLGTLQLPSSKWLP